MPEAQSRDFGSVPYDESDVITFARPLAGFPDRLRFLLIQPRPDTPWIILQSLEDPGTAFLTLPVHLVEPGYEVRMSEDECAALGWAQTPGGAMVLALVAIDRAGTATANLLGPVVVDPATRRAVQAIRDDRRYGAAEPLVAAGKEQARCS